MRTQVPHQLSQTKRSKAPAKKVRLAIPTDFLLDLTSTFRLSRSPSRLVQPGPATLQPACLSPVIWKPQGPRGRTRPPPHAPSPGPGLMLAPPPTHLLQVPASLPLERDPPQPPSPKQPPPSACFKPSHCTQRDLAQLTILGWQGLLVCGSNSSSNILNGGERGWGPRPTPLPSGQFQSPHYPGTNMYLLSCSSNPGLPWKHGGVGPPPQSGKGHSHTGLGATAQRQAVPADVYGTITARAPRPCADCFAKVIT